MSVNLCSIILPFYNSAKFVPEAAKSIAAQTYQNFELILIDDGSSDHSLEIFKNLIADWPQQIKIIQQKNSGSYQARNMGLEQASGDYITFFDIDDHWTPTHLEECIYYLNKYSEIDVVYTNCQMIDLNQESKIIHSSVFNQNGKNNKFLELNTKKLEQLHLITDMNAVKYQILYGLFLGLQFSVFRKKIFNSYRFDACDRNEAEDQLTTIKLLKQNCKIGYLKSIHGTYHLHSTNSSSANKLASRERKIWIIKKVIEGYLKLAPILNLNEKLALRKRIANGYFWGLGYNLGIELKDYNFALKNYLTGLYYWPFNYKFYRSFLKLIFIGLFTKRKNLNSKV